MNIGLVTTSFPRHAGDYAGSFVGDRARCLLAEGHHVHVFAAGDGRPAREIAHQRLTVTRIAPPPGNPRKACPHPGPLPQAGNPRKACPHPGPLIHTAQAGEGALFYGAGAPEALERGGAAVWFEAARFSVALAAAVRARTPRIDLVESHWLVPSTLVALAGAPAGRHRAYAHSGDVALLERIPLGGAIARRFVDAGVALNFVSDALRSRFTALAGAPGPVGAVSPLVPFAGEWPARAGVDVAGRRRLGLAGPTVLAVGRLVPIKGHDRLLRACARVQSRSAAAAPALEVVILGDGPERARLGRLAGELGVHLRLPGFVPRSEVARWLRASDVYVQPSISLANGRSEGAPFATAEARAVGIPVLVESDVGRLAVELSHQLHAAATGV